MTHDAALADPQQPTFTEFESDMFLNNAHHQNMIGNAHPDMLFRMSAANPEHLAGVYLINGMRGTQDEADARLSLSAVLVFGWLRNAAVVPTCGELAELDSLTAIFRSKGPLHYTKDDRGQYVPNVKIPGANRIHQAIAYQFGRGKQAFAPVANYDTRRHQSGDTSEFTTYIAGPDISTKGPFSPTQGPSMLAPVKFDGARGTNLRKWLYNRYLTAFKIWVDQALKNAKPNGQVTNVVFETTTLMGQAFALNKHTTEDSKEALKAARQAIITDYEVQLRDKGVSVVWDHVNPGATRDIRVAAVESSAQEVGTDLLTQEDGQAAEGDWKETLDSTQMRELSVALFGESYVNQWMGDHNAGQISITDVDTGDSELLTTPAAGDRVYASELVGTSLMEPAVQLGTKATAQDRSVGGLLLQTKTPHGGITGAAVYAGLGAAAGVAGQYGQYGAVQEFSWMVLALYQKLYYGNKSAAEELAENQERQSKESKQSPAVLKLENLVTPAVNGKDVSYTDNQVAATKDEKEEHFGYGVEGLERFLTYEIACKNISFYEEKLEAQQTLTEKDWETVMIAGVHCQTQKAWSFPAAITKELKMEGVSEFIGSIIKKNHWDPVLISSLSQCATHRAEAGESKQNTVAPAHCEPVKDAWSFLHRAGSLVDCAHVQYLAHQLLAINKGHKPDHSQSTAAWQLISDLNHESQTSLTVAELEVLLWSATKPGSHARRHLQQQYKHKGWCQPAGNFFWHKQGSVWCSGLFDAAEQVQSESKNPSMLESKVVAPAQAESPFNTAQHAAITQYANMVRRSNRAPETPLAREEEIFDTTAFKSEIEADIAQARCSAYQEDHTAHVVTKNRLFGAAIGCGVAGLAIGSGASAVAFTATASALVIGALVGGGIGLAVLAVVVIALVIGLIVNHCRKIEPRDSRASIFDEIATQDPGQDLPLP